MSEVHIFVFLFYNILDLNKKLNLNNFVFKQNSYLKKNLNKIQILAISENCSNLKKIFKHKKCSKQKICSNIKIIKYKIVQICLKIKNIQILKNVQILKSSNFKKCSNFKNV
jgi:hypothetical protein